MVSGRLVNVLVINFCGRSTREVFGWYWRWQIDLVVDITGVLLSKEDAAETIDVGAVLHVVLFLLKLLLLLSKVVELVGY